jgi:hypothetical protein
MKPDDYELSAIRGRPSAMMRRLEKWVANRVAVAIGTLIIFYIPLTILAWLTSGRSR